jgi:hypothetical protein
MFRSWEHSDTKDILKGLRVSVVPSCIIGIILYSFVSFVWASIVHGLIVFIWWQQFWSETNIERSKAKVVSCTVMVHRPEDLQLCPVRFMHHETFGFYLLVLTEERQKKIRRQSWHAKMAFGIWNEALVHISSGLPEVIAMNHDPFPEKQLLVAQVLPLPLAQMVTNYIIPGRDFEPEFT